jgi:fermentation-respiration switch protein FrsA (DUF1100 family)
VRLPLAALLAYGLWCTALFFGQDRLLFRRDLVRPLPPEQLTWAAKATHLAIPLDAGQTVEAWFLPAPQASREHPAPAVVFCHGNAEAIDNLAWFVRKYHALGCSVLLPEYRGYGRSGGTPSQAGITADAVRFYDMMLERPDVDRRRIVIHGRSLGGGVAAQLAAQRTPAALILESTFTSVASMTGRYLAPPWLARHPFHTDQVLPTLDVPVLVAHGTLDVVIPVEHGRQLSKLARKATYIEYVCGHDDLPPPSQEDEHWRQIAKFLENAGVLDHGP